MFSKAMRKINPTHHHLGKRMLTIATLTDADKHLEKMRVAQEKFYQYPQTKVDHIFERVADNIRKHSMELAKMAVEESRIGCVEDKTLKNIYATEHSVAMYKNTRTAGIIDHNTETGISRIAEPVGPICAILPCTNPTSTVIFKSLYSLKTRNCIVFLPHPRAQRCSNHAVDLIHKYAIEAGAPENVVMSCTPSRDMSDYIMRHKETKFLLATGGTDMVRACYSVGKPAIGVGSGNTPVVVDGTYDLRETVNSIMIGKTFDWGVPCITEQSVIVVESVYDMIKELLAERGVYFLNDDEKDRVSSVFMPDGKKVNADIVGKSPHYIAACAGIEIPSWVLALGVEVSGIGAEEVFSHEKMSPILALYRSTSYEEAVEMARQLVVSGGPGHSACLYTQDEDRIRLFHQIIPAYHININMPALGGIGIRYNPNVAPSMTVGCGVRGGSMSSVNVGPNELIQVKTVARKLTNPLPHNKTTKIIKDTLMDAVRSIPLEKENILVVADQLDNDHELLHYFRTSGHNLMVLNNLTPDMECVMKTAGVLDGFGPTLILVMGGKEMTDATKMLRLWYENRDTPIEKLMDPFIEDERHLINLHRKVRLVAVPTHPNIATMSPFTQHILYKNNNTTFYTPLMRPDIVIHDRSLYDNDRNKIMTDGFIVLLQGIEAFVSIHSTEQTRASLLDPMRQLFSQLDGGHDEGMIHDACANLSALIATNGVGLGTSMASKMSSLFDIPFGNVLSAAIPHIMVFNSSMCPTRGVASPHYPYPMAGQQYRMLARALGFQEQKDLIAALQVIRWEMGFERIHALVSRDIFINHLHELTETTFGDAMHRTNPRMALLPEINRIYKEIYFE